MASRRRRRRPTTHRPKTPTAESHGTSVPTGRAAYMDTRRWLLKRHGPVCAYCGVKWPPRNITLDHVTPRRGLSAYDRRDNLVLACKRCNTIKADKPFLAFLFAQRGRAANVLKYGDHLSHGILDLCRPLAGDAPVAPHAAPQAHTPHAHTPQAKAPHAKTPPAKQKKPRKRYGLVHDPDDSPYA